MSDLKNRVWEILSVDGDLESEFGRESVEAQREATNYAMTLWMKFNDIKIHLNETYNRVQSFVEGSSKTNEEFLDLIKDHPEREALQLMLDNQDINSVIWEKLKPS